MLSGTDVLTYISYRVAALLEKDDNLSLASSGFLYVSMVKSFMMAEFNNLTLFLPRCRLLKKNIFHVENHFCNFFLLLDFPRSDLKVFINK